MMWIILAITMISHVGLVVMFNRQRQQLESLRALVHKQRYVIRNMESQLRLASRKLFK